MRVLLKGTLTQQEAGDVSILATLTLTVLEFSLDGYFVESNYLAGSFM